MRKVFINSQGVALLSANWYRTLIYPTTQLDIMPPPDESTSLLPEARPLNWRQKCGKFFDWFRWCGYILLLLAQVVWLIFTVGTLLGNVKVIANVPATSFPPTTPPKEEILDSQKEFKVYLVHDIVLNVLDILICWIFLGIVARSPRFVCCSTIIKNLIRLPRFWTLVFLLVLYILGAAIVLWFFISSALQKEDATMKVISDKTIALYVMGVVMTLLNAFTKVALVGVLNHVQVRNVARSRFKCKVLKGALVVTWIFEFCIVIGTIVTVYFGFLLPIATDNSYVQQLRSFTPQPVSKLLLLPFVAKTTELMWTKILQDNECIIGNNESNESNSFTRQNPRISNAIEII